jgi:inner membrane protein
VNVRTPISCSSPFSAWRSEAHSFLVPRDDRITERAEPSVAENLYILPVLLVRRETLTGSGYTGAAASRVAKLRPDLNATTHAVFGVAALAGASLLAGTEPPAYAYPVAVAAAWLPDVDNPRSTLGNGLSRMKSPALNLLTRPLSWALRATSFTLVRAVGHRTLTHSLLGVALFALTVWLMLGGYPNLALALVAGYASHVFADALNTRGVPLLWPMGRPFRLLPGGIRSGGAVEVAVALVALGFAGWELYLLYPAVRGVLGVLQPL